MKTITAKQVHDAAALERRIELMLRTPPAPKITHRDRIQWDQAELIAKAVMDILREEGVLERDEGGQSSRPS